MLSRSPARPRKADRRAVPRVAALEARLLLSVDLPPAGAGPIAVPVAIARPIPASGFGAAPYGPWSVGPNGDGPAVNAPYSPAQIRHAYGVDLLPYDGAGQTIAIVDAYDDPTVASDLAAFDSKFGLPAADLTVATPQGKPGYDSGWAYEISLDVQWAHAIAPGAKILLVESISANDTDLLSAVDYAVTRGANQVSMSWGGGEFSGVSSIDGHFNHPGVTFLAASGDSGREAEFPAVSPYVTGVGGTTISLDAAGDKLSETAWSGSGGDVSSFVTRPSFQDGFEAAPRRGVPDVSYNADPGSGYPIYDGGALVGVGGTSAGAPQWAGLIALANQGRAAAGLPPVGTGKAFGTNTVLYGLAGGGSYTNPNGDFLDITSGSNGLPAGPGYDNVTGLGSPVANKLIPDLVGTTAPPPAVPAVGDAGFEAVAVGSGSFGSFAYDPAGSAWAFAGQAGVSGNYSGFTSGNPAAPQGGQVGFLQAAGSFSQSIAGWAAGSYQVNFLAAQRGNYGASAEDFQVLIDGVAVSTFRPAGTAYSAYASASFAVGAGSHTVTFRGLDTAGGDNTAFIDAVAIAAAPPAVPAVGDAGFEAVAVGSGSFGSFAYDPAGSAWAFAGQAGVSGNSSGFTAGNPAAPQGGQVGFLQAAGSFSQSIAGWAAGSYQVGFLAAQRGNYGASAEDFQVLVDGVAVSTFRPAGTGYSAYASASFAVAAGTHTVTFRGLDSAGGDNTAFIDAVAIARTTG